ncbi:MAG: aminotransferase class V-fold PLP-dependent enzyme [Holosporaceae bacterium]|jgi:cysteine desulfurase|nr:aminotransferase class V-fold PLP-dependent enzyme [Holosporaceae bacterium]
MINSSHYFIASLLFLTSCASGGESFWEKSIYLDRAASWGIDDDALIEFLKVSRLHGNSSGINPHAKRLKKLEEQSAKIIANKIHADHSDQIHFTNGATTANNIAILGAAYKNPKCHLITSKIEHKSVLNVFKYLESLGYRVTYLNVDSHGVADLIQLRKSICPDTKLISIQIFNSEIGALQNVKTIGKIAKEHGVLFHTDAAQSFCKYDINVKDMNIDLLTLSGHKIGAPKGIGALYVRDIHKLQPLMFGSGDPLFPGTKPTPLICAFAKAVENFNFRRDRINSNFNVLVQELLKIEGVYINSSTPSHIVSVSLDGVLLSDILEQMKNYSFSAGCSCLGQNKSDVIAAIDPNDKLPSCTIRISFSDRINKEQLIDFAKKLKSVVERLRKEKSVGKGCESADVKPKDLRKSLDNIRKLLEKRDKAAN